MKSLLLTASFAAFLPGVLASHASAQRLLVTD
jgi:hypothetical protein